MDDKPFHIKILLTELQNRKLSNPRYSLRAFSRFLGIGASNLSRILSNSQEVSLPMSINIIKKLRLNKRECLLFIASIAEEKKLRSIEILSEAIEDEQTDGLLRSYEWIQSTTEDLMFVIDPDGRCILASDAVLRFFNPRTSNIIGKTLLEMGIPHDIAKKIKGSMKDVIRTSQKLNLEDCYTTADGLRCFEVKLVPVINRHSEVEAIACHWKDITEKTKVARLLNLILEENEIIQKAKSSPQLEKDFLKPFMRDFCDAVILRLDQSVHQEGDKELVLEFFTLYPEKHFSPSKRNEVLNHLDEANLILLDKSDYRIGAFLRVPLIVFEKVVGNMIFIRFPRKEFTEKEIEVASTIVHRLSDGLEKLFLLENSP